MDDAKAEEIALKAQRLHIARVESEGDKPLNLAAAIELCDQFAISGMKAEDFQLNAVANLLASMAKGRNRGWATCSVAILKTPPNTSSLTD